MDNRVSVQEPHAGRGVWLIGRKGGTRKMVDRFQLLAHTQHHLKRYSRASLVDEATEGHTVLHIDAR